MKVILKTLFFTFVLSIICSANIDIASASEICGGDFNAQASASIQLVPGNNELYVRAGRIEDARRAKLYFQTWGTSESACSFIGEVTLSADTWQRIGMLQSSNDMGTLYLDIDTNEPTEAGASRPSIIMTTTTPPCSLENGCIVNYQNRLFELSPKKISLSSDTLRVGMLSSPDMDKLKEVIYSVDGRQVYKSKILEVFNERYVAGGEHSLERTVVLVSGQSLTDARILSKGSLADPGYWFTSLYTRYSRLLVYIGAIVGAFLVGFIWISIARLFYKRRMWRINHIARTPGSFPKQTHKSHEFDGSALVIFKQHKKLFFTPLVGLVLFILVLSYVFNIFTVDGISMEPTLRDRSRKILFMLPAQLGKLNSSGYLPDRGTIVVVQKDENNLFDDDIEQSKEYVVKRVIALPEERVVIDKGIMIIFNTEHKEGFVPDESHNWVADRSGSEYIKLDITLQQNELFVVGDNRDNSIDSRYYGPIQASKVVGKVL